MSIRLLEGDAFYHQLLNEEEYNLYLAAINALADKRYIVKERFTYDEKTFNDSLERVGNAIILGHPELFYVRPEISSTYQNGEVQMVFDFIYDEDDIDEYNKVLTRNIDQIVNELSGINDPMELLYRLNEYLCLHFEGENCYTDNNGNAYGVTVHKMARCEGFCKVAKLVLNRFNINSIIVTGECKGYPHTWMAIMYNNQYYAFDFAHNCSYSTDRIAVPVFTFLDKETISMDGRTEKYTYPITDDKSYLFWRLHKGEVNYLTDLANADVISAEIDKFSIHHFVDISKFTDYTPDDDMLDSWVANNCAPQVKGLYFAQSYIEDLKVLVVYYLAD